MATKDPRGEMKGLTRGDRNLRSAMKEDLAAYMSPRKSGQAIADGEREGARAVANLRETKGFKDGGIVTSKVSTPYACGGKVK